MKYKGYFSTFSEMGSGINLVFEDIKTDYLSGYSQLDFTYFFKHNDVINKLTVFKESTAMEFNNILFCYDSRYGCIPSDIDFKLIKEWISNRYLIILETDDILYEDSILINENMNRPILLNEIDKLFQTQNSKLDKRLIKIKNELKYIKKICLEINQKFGTYIYEKQDFLFNSSILEVILRGDGESLIKYFKEHGY